MERLASLVEESFLKLKLKFNWKIANLNRIKRIKEKKTSDDFEDQQAKQDEERTKSDSNNAANNNDDNKRKIKKEKPPCLQKIAGNTTRTERRGSTGQQDRNDQ